MLLLFLGICAHDHLPIQPGFYALLAAALALLSLPFRRQHHLATTLLAISVLTIGIAAAQGQRYFFPPDHLLHQVGDQPLITQLRLEILEPLQIRQTTGEPPLAATVARVLAVQQGDTWQPRTGKLLLRVQPSPSDWRPGIIIQAIGELSRIQAPANPGEFDWQKHFAADRIALRFAISHASGATQLADNGEGLLWAARRQVREALGAGFSPDQQLDRALLQTLLLGDNDDRLQQVWTDFRRSGTAHHLSIGGMHLAILTLVIFLLCRLLLLHPRTALLVSLTFIVGYGLLTRSSPPVIRSVMMCCCAGLAMLSRRNTDPLQCLCVGVWLILIFYPLDALNPGFQLSVGTVIGMILLTRRFQGLVAAFENEHDRMARRIRPPTGWAALVLHLRQHLGNALAAGIIAWVVSLPVIALHFRQINPWAIPCSILLEPLIILAMLAGLLKILLSLLFYPLAPIAAVMASTPSFWMRQLVQFMAQWPGAEFATLPIPFWLVTLYLLLLAVPLLPQLRRYRASWLAPAVAVLLASSLPLWTFAHAHASRNQLRITLLSVGNGSCTVLELPSGQNALVDCGTLANDQLFPMTIVPYLRERGLLRIDTVLLTHGDRDHNSALPQVVAAFAPQLRQHSTQGEKSSLDPLCPYEILWPPSATTLTGNNASLVIRLAYAGKTILFTGDIEEAAIQGLLESHQDLHADILVAPHHGSCVPSTGRFLTAVSPQLIVSSSGRHLSAKQLQFDSLVSGQTSLRTGKVGAITITFSPQGSLTTNGFISPR